MEPTTEAEKSSPTQPETLSVAEKRKGKYLENLLRLETLNVEDFYPPEVIKRQWEEVLESPELAEFMENFTIFDTQEGHRFDKRLLNVFRDSSTGEMFAAPAFPTRLNTRQVLLDMLATAKELAPWAAFKGLKWEKGEEFFEPHLPRMYTFQRNWILIFPPVLINIVNGLGAEKYTNEQKRNFLIEDISACIHESVHINNEPDMDMGGPHRVLVELATTTSEYLAFPGKNEKMERCSNLATQLLLKKAEKYDYYDEALLIGLLILAKESDYLSDQDDPEILVQGIQKWQEYIESLSRDQLEPLRRKFEEKYLLSVNDTKLVFPIQALRVAYPKSLAHLSLINWQHLGKE